jgi:hypothetical protein
MATGYTAAIEDGISFHDFILRCARGMGACIMQRDDPANDPPKIQEISDYHKKALVEAETKLKEIKEMTDGVVAQKAKEENDTEIASIEAGIRKNNNLRDKYRAMLSQVEAWQPPTPDHIGLKTFMLEQIRESISFDCGGSYYQDRLKEAAPLSAQEWKAKHLKKALWDFNYHKDELSKEIERAESRNNWIRRLYESLETKGSAA